MLGFIIDRESLDRSIMAFERGKEIADQHTKMK
jgi:hypothetical protein